MEEEKRDLRCGAGVDDQESEGAVRAAGGVLAAVVTGAFGGMCILQEGQEREEEKGNISIVRESVILSGS